MAPAKDVDYVFALVPFATFTLYWTGRFSILAVSLALELWIVGHCISAGLAIKAVGYNIIKWTRRSLASESARLAAGRFLQNVFTGSSLAMSGSYLIVVEYNPDWTTDHTALWAIALILWIDLSGAYVAHVFHLARQINWTIAGDTGEQSALRLFQTMKTGK